MQNPMLIFSNGAAYLTDTVRQKIFESDNKVNQLDTVVILDNISIDYLYAYNTVISCMDDQKNIINYFSFSDNDIGYFKQYALLKGVTFCDYHSKVNDEKLMPIGVPVFYITGMGVNCNQVDIHILLDGILNTKGMKVLNLTNSKYGNLFCYDVIDISHFCCFDQIVLNINRYIYDKIEYERPDVIIISDVGGVQPYNAVIHNNYGFFNNILKYACPYDYVLFSVYANVYDKETLNKIINKTSKLVNKDKICLCVGHSITTMSIAGLSDNDEYITVNENEHAIILDSIKSLMDCDVLDSCSKDDLEAYIEMLIND